MLDGFRSRWITPAECTYFRPRRIWYRKYWMNCCSSGRDCRSRCRSVPSSSVTKYMSSSDEMKMSLMLMMFSCRRCFSSFSSRYVRLASTDELNGRMIFLTATACP
ncbi:hypothetical protein EC988_007454, partial [Linderina pennispora]